MEQWDSTEAISAGQGKGQRCGMFLVLRTQERARESFSCTLKLQLESLSLQEPQEPLDGFPVLWSG